MSNEKADLKVGFFMPADSAGQGLRTAYSPRPALRADWRSTCS